MSRFKQRVAFTLTGALLGAAVGVPATAVGPEAQIFYAGCDLFAEAPDPVGAHFATSFRSPVPVTRAVVIRKVGEDGFWDESPVPAFVREGRDLIADSNGTWEVVVRLNGETGPVLAQKIQNVNCPNL